MQGNIPVNTLLVVSDTAMYHQDGKVLVFDPVLRELRAIDDMFQNIIWLGARSLNKKPSLKPIENSRIKAIVMPCVSRTGWKNILYVLAAYPVFIYHLLRHIGKATHVHTRGPSHPAFVAIIFSLFDRKRIYSHKYAGEWTTNNIPLTYRIQRGILRRISNPSIRITISGKNSTNASNVYDLQNPCIYESEISAMNATGFSKKFDGPLTLLFAGNLMPSKGIMELLEALKNPSLDKRYTKLIVAGGGKLLDEVMLRVKDIHSLDIKIAGDISREELNLLYAEAHVLILPSSSESFPKVVAEAAAYGCIPVTTALSAITKQIYDGQNGFLMNNNQPEEITAVLNRLAAIPDPQDISRRAIDMSRLFTYERFRQAMAKVYSINS